MNKLKLMLISIKCIDDTNWEPGSDEMNIWGFGMTKSGQRLEMNYTDIGSFHTGQVKDVDYKVLFEADIPNNALEVSFAIWMSESDAAQVVRRMFDGIRAGVWSQFNHEYNLLPESEDRNLKSFNNSLPNLDERARSVASFGGAWAGDEVIGYRAFNYKYPGAYNNLHQPITSGFMSGENTVLHFSGQGGKYDMYVNWYFEAAPSPLVNDQGTVNETIRPRE